MALRHDADVVGHEKRVFVGRFVHQRENAAVFAVAFVTPDLPALIVAAARCSKVNSPLFIGTTALKPRECRSALCQALLVNGALIDVCFNRIGIIDRHPNGVVVCSDLLAFSRVELWLAIDGEHLQRTALSELLFAVGNKSVKSGRAHVFGLIDNALLVESNCLVNETPHCLERDCLDRRICGCGHIETISVRFGKAAAFYTFGTCSNRLPERGFLTSYPTAPRRRPAGAVDQRARQTDEISNDRAGFWVDHKRRSAASGRVVVVNGRTDRRSGDRHFSIRNLVIANNTKLVPDLESPHSIVRTRRWATIGHDVFDAANDVVFKALWQGEKRLACVLGGGRNKIAETNGSQRSRLGRFCHCQGTIAERRARQCQATGEKR